MGARCPLQYKPLCTACKGTPATCPPGRFTPAQDCSTVDARELRVIERRRVWARVRSAYTVWSVGPHGHERPRGAGWGGAYGLRCGRRPGRGPFLRKQRPCQNNSVCCCSNVWNFTVALAKGGCPASGGGCLPQPRWAVCATGAGAHQGQTNCEGEKDIWWTARTARGGTGHLGRTETQRGRLWTACGQRCVDSKNSQTTPATTSTSSIRQLLGAADTQTAHHATFSTAPTHQLLGSANAETTPARAPATAADRKQQPDATCEGKTG